MKNEYDYLNDVKMNFSCYEETDKETNIMKRGTNKYKKMFLAAACITLITITTAVASGVAGNIIKTITTGYNRFVQTDSKASQPVMDELKGKIFDENGTVLEYISSSDFDNIYDKDGNKITHEVYAKMIEEATGGLVEVSYEYNPEEAEKPFATLEEAQHDAVFDIKTPAYLPDGYSFSRVYTYKNDDGTASGEYITIEYKNSAGENITIFERILNENTAFETGTDGTLEELEINGRKAVIMDERTINFETEDDVSVGISTHGNITKDELIKIAESVN